MNLNTLELTNIPKTGLVILLLELGKILDRLQLPNMMTNIPENF